jgi:L-asparaginase
MTATRTSSIRSYIVSRVWADEGGRNRAGVVLVQDQQVFAARDVQKADARPGGYVATGGHGGILGAAGWEGPAVLTYLPATRHTYLSAVNVTRLPVEVTGRLRSGQTRVPIKDRRGEILESAIPKVTIVKDGNYTVDDSDDDPSREVDLLGQIDRNLAAHPLAGFVVEGLAPYGRLTSPCARASCGAPPFRACPWCSRVAATPRDSCRLRPLRSSEAGT